MILQDESILARWQDDFVIVCSHLEEQPELGQALHKYKDKHAYGDTLFLERVKQNEAFGFKLYELLGKLMVMQKNRFHSIRKEGAWIDPVDTRVMNVGRWFQSNGLVAAELKGVLFSVLDMTNATPGALVRAIARVVVEFLKFGGDKTLLEETLMHVQKIARNDLPGGLRSLPEILKEKIEEVRRNYDKLEEDYSKLEVELQNLRWEDEDEGEVG